MGNKIKVEYIDHMGTDLSVVNSARVSFDKESELEYLPWNEGMGSLKESDQKLIKFLAKHKHWTPFAHTAITFRIGAPVPIRTQCFKHKQGFVENEESRRYISSVPEIFIPDEFRSKPLGSAKQGSGNIHEKSEYWLETYTKHCNDALNTYSDMIADGVCPEQARFILPQGAIVNWYWTGSLAAYARFYVQRSDAHAQKEIQYLASRISEEISDLFPISWKCLINC